MTKKRVLVMALCAAVGLSLGLPAFAQSGQTQKSTLRGAGLGALLGQAMGHDTGSTIAGAVVGAGVGRVVGKKKEQEQEAQATQAAPPQQTAALAPSAPAGQPTAPAAVAGADDPAQALYDSFWQVESIMPKDIVPPFFSKLVLFLRDGRVQTVTTTPEGKASLNDESFSAVGDTLVVSKPDLQVQVKYKVEGDQLILSAEKFSAVLKRVRSE